MTSLVPTSRLCQRRNALTPGDICAVEAARTLAVASPAPLPSSASDVDGSESEPPQHQAALGGLNFSLFGGFGETRVFSLRPSPTSAGGGGSGRGRPGYRRCFGLFARGGVDTARPRSRVRRNAIGELEAQQVVRALAQTRRRSVVDEAGVMRAALALGTQLQVSSSNPRRRMSDGCVSLPRGQAGTE